MGIMIPIFQRLRFASNLSFLGVFLGLGATLKDGNHDYHLSEAPFCLRLVFLGVFMGLGATVNDGNHDSHLSKAPICLKFVFFRGLLGPWGHSKRWES